MREYIGLNRNWKFTTEEMERLPRDAYLYTKTGAQDNAAAMAFDDSTWKLADLPHDYTVSGRLDPANSDYNGYLSRPNAWYRRFFTIPEEDSGKRILLHFDGVSGESKVWVNGCLMKINHSSYCGFEIDITEVVSFGREVNLITVYLDHSETEGWWYQAGGIYRKVSLIKTEQVFLIPERCVITSQKQCGGAWSVKIEAGIGSKIKQTKNLTAALEIKDTEGQVVFRDNKNITFNHREEDIQFDFTLERPKLWDIGEGNLYQCVLKVMDKTAVLDEVTQMFGIREFRFDCEKGFYLNDKQHEIRGFCYHEDEGNLGWAIDAHTYENRIRNLLEMGGNAYRCTHNPPAKELLDICDKYGVLVIGEVRKFSTSEIALDELRYMVCRDRNHPCIILWSMGNEEPWQGEIRGARIMEIMRETVRELDSTRPVLMAMHEGFLEEGAAQFSDVIGVNYHHSQFDAVHEAYPDKPMIGTENYSLSDHFQDGTGSPTGSDKAYETLRFKKLRDFVAGTFAWAGQDYRGEHRNLSFFTDCCPTDCTGGRKDGFYEYAAYWKKEPVLHICGHWNDTGEEKRRITIISNVDEVGLFLNENELGRRKPDRNNYVTFEVNYEEGRLEAVGYRGGVKVAETLCETTSDPVRFLVRPDQIEAEAGQKRIFLTVEAVDESGRRCPTASQSFHVCVNGPGRILCCDNPDPYSTWWETAEDMNVYKGVARIVLETGIEPGILEVRVESSMLEGDACAIRVLPAVDTEAAACINPYINEWFVSYVFHEKPDIYQWPTDDYYITWKKYWEPALQTADNRCFYYRKGYVICCQEQDLPEIVSGGHAALVFEKIRGQAEFLISARDYNNRIIRRVYHKKESAEPERVRIELPGFKSGDRMIMKVLLKGECAEDGIAGNVKFEL